MTDESPKASNTLRDFYLAKKGEGQPTKSGDEEVADLLAALVDGGHVEELNALVALLCTPPIESLEKQLNEDDLDLTSKLDAKLVIDQLGFAMRACSLCKSEELDKGLLKPILFHKWVTDQSLGERLMFVEAVIDLYYQSLEDIRKGLVEDFDFSGEGKEEMLTTISSFSQMMGTVFLAKDAVTRIQEFYNKRYK